jgi:hypothetical protein
MRRERPNEDAAVGCRLAPFLVLSCMGKLFQIVFCETPIYRENRISKLDLFSTRVSQRFKDIIELENAIAFRRSIGTCPSGSAPYRRRMHRGEVREK